ncbi:MAG: hypothetical protein J3Q66DRAFT_331817 [Benniella sp.]|nr:MAG: hypothetical protein J3Q66DRAFT_331817 [Benniella sp.]
MRMMRIHCLTLACCPHTSSFLYISPRNAIASRRVSGSHTELVAISPRRWHTPHWNAGSRLHGALNTSSLNVASSPYRINTSAPRSAEYQSRFRSKLNPSLRLSRNPFPLSASVDTSL